MYSKGFHCKRKYSERKIVTGSGGLYWCKFEWRWNQSYHQMIYFPTINNASATSITWSNLAMLSFSLRFCLSICTFLTSRLHSYKLLLADWSWVSIEMWTYCSNLLLLHFLLIYTLSTISPSNLTFRLATWIRVSVWFAIGALVYMFYGRTHSSLVNAVYVRTNYVDEIYRSSDHVA